jgi:hypothetical protein
VDQGEDSAMNKRELAILEKAFLAEINGMLPFQTNSKIAAKLANEGMLIPMETTFGRGTFAVVCKGYQLSHAGRFAYCSTCDDDEDETISRGRSAG